MEELVPMGAMPMYEQSASAKYEFGEAKKDSVPKMTGRDFQLYLVSITSRRGMWMNTLEKNYHRHSSGPLLRTS